MSLDRLSFRDRLHRVRPSFHFDAGLTENERADRHLTVITVLLLLMILVGPPVIASGVVQRHVVDAIGVVVVVAGVVVGFGELRLTRIIVVLALVLAALRVANLWLPDRDLRLADAIFAIVVTGLLGWFMLLRLLRPTGRVNFHRVMGAVGVYLVFGVVFAQAHRIVAMFAPDAYIVLGTPADYDTVVPQLPYFSFVVLTSLGFGDITPLHPVARALVTLEALLGVLFPAILISRLVSLEVNREDDR